MKQRNISWKKQRTETSLGTADKLQSQCCLTKVVFQLLQSCLTPTMSWERGHSTAAAPGTHCQAGWPVTARCLETNEKSKDNISSSCMSVCYETETMYCLFWILQARDIMLPYCMENNRREKQWFPPSWLFLWFKPFS